MPTYNQARYLPEALASLSPESGQAPHILAVVNDASTDDTGWVLSRGPHRVDAILHHTENRGCAASINAGVFMLGAKTDAEALTWVSSDNVMYPSWIATLSAALKPGVGAVYSAFDMPGQKGKTITVRQEAYDPARLVSSENCYFGPSFLIRAEVWREAGPHEGGSAHDYGHWARVEEVCWRRGLSIVYVDEPLCWYRVHEEQTVKRRPDLYDAAEQRAKALARRAAR